MYKCSTSREIGMTMAMREPFHNQVWTGDKTLKKGKITQNYRTLDNNLKATVEACMHKNLKQKTKSS